MMSLSPDRSQQPNLESLCWLIAVGGSNRKVWTNVLQGVGQSPRKDFLPSCVESCCHGRVFVAAYGLRLHVDRTDESLRDQSQRFQRYALWRRTADRRSDRSALRSWHHGGWFSGDAAARDSCYDQRHRCVHSGEIYLRTAELADFSDGKRR
jgi:hypothetical protein